jgi:hypothetical protein
MKKPRRRITTATAKNPKTEKSRKNTPPILLENAL